MNNPFMGQNPEMLRKRLQELESAPPSPAFKDEKVRQEYEEVDPDLRMFLQGAPDPFKFNSGRRTPEENLAVGGVPNSLHLTGGAVDIDPSSMTPRNKQYLLSNKNIKLIDELDKNHYHAQKQGSLNPFIGQDPQKLIKRLEELEAQPNSLSSAGTQNKSLSLAEMHGGKEAEPAYGLPKELSMLGAAITGIGQSMPASRMADYATRGILNVIAPGEKTSVERYQESNHDAYAGGRLAGDIVSSIPMAIGGTPKIASMIGKGLLPKLAAGGLTNLGIGQLQRGMKIDPVASGIDLATGGIGEAVSAARSAVDPIAKSIGSKLFNSALGINKDVLKKGINPGLELMERGTGASTLSSMESAASSAIETFENSLEEVLSKSKGAVPTESIANKVGSLVDDLKGVPATKNQAKAIEEAYLDLIEQNPDSIPIKEANALKRRIYKVLGDKAYKADASIPAVSKQIQKSTAKALKEGVEFASEDVASPGVVKGINKELQLQGIIRDAAQEKLAREGVRDISTYIPYVASGMMGAGGFALGGTEGASLGALVPIALGTSYGKTALARGLGLAGKGASMIPSTKLLYQARHLGDIYEY